ncbi:MAG: c-type cytochrome [Burkholderiales bacterium]
MKKLLMRSVGVLVGAAVTFTAFAQAKPEVLVKQREAAMTLIGKYWGPLGRMAQGKAPYNGEVVARNAGYLEVLSKMPWDGFQASTRDVKSRALPAVFDQPEKFKEAQQRLESAVGKLAAASKGGDEGAVKAAMKEVGQSCGGCHKNFREKR